MFTETHERYVRLPCRAMWQQLAIESKLHVCANFDWSIRVSVFCVKEIWSPHIVNTASTSYTSPCGVSGTQERYMRLPCRAMWQQLVLIGQSYVHILIGQFEMVASVCKVC